MVCVVCGDGWRGCAVSSLLPQLDRYCVPLTYAGGTQQLFWRETVVEGGGGVKGERGWFW